MATTAYLEATESVAPGLAPLWSAVLRVAQLLICWVKFGGLVQALVTNLKTRWRGSERKPMGIQGREGAPGSPGHTSPPGVEQGEPI